jgi:hypothetical protein
VNAIELEPKSRSSPSEPIHSYAKFGTYHHDTNKAGQHPFAKKLMAKTGSRKTSEPLLRWIFKYSEWFRGEVEWNTWCTTRLEFSERSASEWKQWFGSQSEKQLWEFKRKTGFSPIRLKIVSKRYE